MHAENPFMKAYNLTLLGQHHAPLKEFVFNNKYGNESIDFADRQAVIALNAALLKTYYGVSWQIPANNLCPPIPGRLDYLLHIADLIPKPKLRLLDIGTGANLIYPILASCHFNWDCVASEVDKNSFKSAQEIIQKNKELHKIDLRFQQYKSKIFAHIIQPQDVFDVVICNPPFYKNQYDAQQKNQRKVKNLQLKSKDALNFGGCSNELWYKGGEEAFIKKMIAESEDFKAQVHWFTSLVSRKEHLRNLKRAINKTSATQVKIVEMEQGNKKSRFIAWRF
jgi:23S rRNA (adenine1618-N6)-methyltransferase